MGTAFTLGVVADTVDEADRWLRDGVEEIQRVEALLSAYRSDSVTTFINEAPAHRPIYLEEEVLQLIQRCQDIARLTRGYFDITSRSVHQMYSFENVEARMPSDAEIAEVLQSVGYSKLRLDMRNKSIEKLVSGIHICFNAIGKGYVADVVKKLWISKGVKSGYINASGDLSVLGKKQDGNPWNIAIADPNDATIPLLHIPLYNQSIATSGDSEQFFIHQGKKYAHNINPITGKPVVGVKSVSVVSPSAELSDALATAIYAMGIKRGLDFANQLPQTYVLIIDNNNQVSFTQNFNYEAYNS